MVEGKHYNITVMKGALLLHRDYLDTPVVRSRPNVPMVPEVDLSIMGMMDVETTVRAKVHDGWYEFMHEGKRIAVRPKDVKVL